MYSWLDYFIPSSLVPSLPVCGHLEMPSRLESACKNLCTTEPCLPTYSGLQPYLGTGCLHFPERQHVSIVRAWVSRNFSSLLPPKLTPKPRAPDSLIFFRNPGAYAAPQLTCRMFLLSRTHPEPNHFDGVEEGGLLCRGTLRKKGKWEREGSLLEEAQSTARASEE